MDAFPDQLKTREGLSCFVWGHELDLHDAGRNGGNGSADLLIADEEGMVWLAEAKFFQTTERGDFVWGNQLRRYKQSIESMDWADILQYAAKFIRGCEKTKPAFVLPESVRTFTGILAYWQQLIGRQLVDPAELNARIASHIANGTYGLMVLTDISDTSYAEYGRNFVHSGPLAYVVAVPVKTGISFEIRWFRSAANAPEYLDINSCFSNALDVPIRSRCTPELFSDGLGKEARELWTGVLRPSLERLGAEFVRPSGMGFEVSFPVSGAPCPLLLVGWPERDDRNVPRAEKRFGSGAMRVDVHIKNFFRATRDVALTNELMRAVHAIGWRGRPSKGMLQRWGVQEISAEELDSKVQGIMRYLPSENLSCHNGRPGDAESLLGLIACLTSAVSKTQLSTRAA